MERIPLLTAIVAASLLVGCGKEDRATPTSAPATSTITSMCIGSWNVDSTYLPSAGQYYPVVPKVYAFSNNGHVTISSAGGVQSDWAFQVVQESATPAPGEIGRTLIWATTDSDPEVQLVILLLHQSTSEGFLLISTSLGHASPWNSLTTVTEDLIVNGTTIFPSWAKCHRQ